MYTTPAVICVTLYYYHSDVHCFFQKPGVVHVNGAMPGFPNIWSYNCDMFVHATLGTKLLMSNKLIKKAKRSIAHIRSVGPQTGESTVQWEVCIANVTAILHKHQQARDLLEKDMYSSGEHLNGDV